MKSRDLIFECGWLWRKRKKIVNVHFTLAHDVHSLFVVYVSMMNVGDFVISIHIDFSHNIIHIHNSVLWDWQYSMKYSSHSLCPKFQSNKMDPNLVQEEVVHYLLFKTKSDKS